MIYAGKDDVFIIDVSSTLETFGKGGLYIGTAQLPITDIHASEEPDAIPPITDVARQAPIADDAMHIAPEYSLHHHE